MGILQLGVQALGLRPDADDLRVEAFELCLGVPVRGGAVLLGGQLREELLLGLGQASGELLPGGVQLLQIAAAVTSLREVHHGHGHLVHHPVPVHPAVEQRIDQSCEAEDQHHAAVRPEQVQFIGQNAQEVAEPAAHIAYSILFHRS